MDEVAEKQQKLFALRTTVFEQFGRDTVGSWSLVIGHGKQRLVDSPREKAASSRSVIPLSWTLTNSTTNPHKMNQTPTRRKRTMQNNVIEVVFSV
jgi:hypothetical protein